MPRYLTLVATMSLLLTGCSGPPQASEADGEGADETVRERPTDPSDDVRAAVSEYERFDASKYPVRAPESSERVTHDVPNRLMRGRADEGIQQTLEGFRVQVFSAQDQGTAQDFREQVRRWWASVKEEAPDPPFTRRPPIVIEYAQPYYRVRVGAFADREDAADALAFIQNEYPDAFIAQSTVTVTR
jgi:hypothetical protein